MPLFLPDPLMPNVNPPCVESIWAKLCEPCCPKDMAVSLALVLATVKPFSTPSLKESIFDHVAVSLIFSNAETLSLMVCLAVSGCLNALIFLIFLKLFLCLGEFV
ncbi:MAG: hypothetical protein J6V99_06375 [Neisseriaceae bacterium]|nr:hypothetical protein [Neisseriaceae bacterium]